jgi:hypothetical protein
MFDPPTLHEGRPDASRLVFAETASNIACASATAAFASAICFFKVAPSAAPRPRSVESMARFAAVPRRSRGSANRICIVYSVKRLEPLTTANDTAVEAKVANSASGTVRPMAMP